MSLTYLVVFNFESLSIWFKMRCPLAFILFTEAVNQFPFANMWAVMFFLMLLTLGLDSQFGTLQGVVQCIVDLKLFSNVRKEIVTGE